jgi:hypothetical protein
MKEIVTFKIWSMKAVFHLLVFVLCHVFQEGKIHVNVCVSQG